ncbi:MAG: NifU family protein [Chloroflexi bacterium]|nr:NifU family protein [Chloroflexota bacterium]
MRDRVMNCIDKLIPAFGVNIVELVDVDDGVVKVRLFPSVCSVGIAPDTMLELLEEQIQEEIPEIKEVVVVD